MRRILTAAAPTVLVALLALPTAATGTHVRPIGAPMKIDFLAISYNQCTSAGAPFHGAPVSAPSCAPPVQTSPYLTAGTLDANGAPAGNWGRQRLDVCRPSGYAGCPASDVRIVFHDQDIRCNAAFVSSACGPTNTAGPPDYTGEIAVTFTLRITDHYNGSSGVDPGTVVDFPFTYAVPCVPTGPGIGSTCDLSTTFNGVITTFATNEYSKRANIGIGQVLVTDGGRTPLAARLGTT
jgi:hypothetical protein